ncbi:MAG: hypothetical protein RBT03_03190 [Kiritimatiellia bacterium]|jgi:hypothetical protein|nr:hypothetical protein [Kiritimatiellia bacterium]
MSPTRPLFKRLIHEQRHYLFYSYQAGQGAGHADEHVHVCDTWAAIPSSWREIVAPSPWRDPKYYRLRRGAARLLCYSGNGQTLEAYGWVQDWRPFRRKFGKLAADGTMLGPYRTVPQARGQGLYGRLLMHSLSICSKEKPVLIYTAPENVASQRGIEKLGFRFLGEWVLDRWLVGFVRLRQQLSKKDARVAVCETVDSSVEDRGTQDYHHGI